jgi:hypothetical protein
MRTLQVQRTLAVGGVLTRGALEGVVAAGGKLDGAFAQCHRLFDGDDLQAGDGGEAGSKLISVYCACSLASCVEPTKC